MQNGATSTGTADATALDVAGLAAALTETLQLRHAPVALAFVTAPPDGVEPFAGAVPSACALWRRAEQSVFYAATAVHLNCPIGALTMGFSMPKQSEEHLMQLVGTMGEIGYVDPDEAANIPAVAGEKSGIVYGPLAEFPLGPDIVLAWVSGRGAMLLDEATGASRWTAEQAGIATFGRPSCAAVAVAANRGAPVFSVGCSGMRIFTGIDADLNLAVLPRPILDDLGARLMATEHANAQMTEYYVEQKERFAAPAT